MKDRKDFTVSKAFQETLDKSGRKPNKIWVDKGSKFYDKDIEMYSMHNEEKSVVAERFFEPKRTKFTNI